MALIAVICVTGIVKISSKLGFNEGDSGVDQASAAIGETGKDTINSSSGDVVESERNTDRQTAVFNHLAGGLSGDPEKGEDFEDGLETSYTIYGVGQTLEGWTVVSGNVETNSVERHGFGTGSRAMDLNGTTPGAIERQLSTVPGVAYSLSFTVAENVYCGPGVKQMAVSWNGERISEISVDLPKGSLKSYKVDIPQSGAKAGTLRLEGLSSGSCGVVVDSLSVGLEGKK